MEQEAAADFATTLEADEEALSSQSQAQSQMQSQMQPQMRSQSQPLLAPVLTPVLWYRVQRKRLWRVVEDVLRAHLEKQSE